MKVYQTIARTLLGLVFLVSGFAKAWSAGDFADTVLQYGPAWFSVFAPLIILSELVLGTMLMCNLYTQWVSLMSAIFLIVVSLIYAYGILFLGITDCGCFGSIDILRTKPWVTYCRNSVLIILSLTLWRYNTSKVIHPLRKLVLVFAVTIVGCFLTGMTLGTSYTLPKIHLTHFKPISTHDFGMDDIVSFSSDSVYAVYLFSFTCPHCQNAFANVEQYQTMHVVDKVLGIAIADSVAQEVFDQLYHPVIDIITIPSEQMSSLTHSLPMLMLIENDTIRNAVEESVSSPGILFFHN